VSERSERTLEPGLDEAGTGAPEGEAPPAEAPPAGAPADEAPGVQAPAPGAPAPGAPAAGLPAAGAPGAAELVGPVMTDVPAPAIREAPAVASGDEPAVSTADEPVRVMDEPVSAGAEPVGAEAEESRWTRFSPAPARVPGRAERVLLRIGRFSIHEWTLAALAALALAVIMTWPCALHPATTIPSDIWDPTLQAWEMAWAGHILTTDPGQLWNANAFYPDAYSFAFSDTLLGYLPASLIGSGPTAALVRYNIMFILLHALAFFGAYALVRQLGGARIAAAVAGAAFAYTPWRWGQAGHMHVLSVGGIALSLAMLARGHGFSLVPDEARRARRPGWAIAGWLTATWQMSLGFGIGLPFAYALAGLFVLAVVAWLAGGRRALGRRLVIADGVGLVIFGAVSLLLAQPYLKVLRLHPEAERSIEDVRMYSPTVRSFFTAPEQSLFWGSAHAAARAAMPYPAETTLLVGFTLYGLAFAGLFFSVWSIRARLLLLAGALGSGILALGTNFHGGKYSYVPLFDHLPGWSAIRTPGRLVIWVTLLLAILAAGAVSALVRRSTDLVAERVPSRPGPLLRLFLLIPLVLVLAEGTTWRNLPHPVIPTQPAAMRTVGAPLMVLPSEPLTDMNVMLWSTSRFQRMVNGNSGFYPTDQTHTRDVVKSFPDQASVDYLRRLGVRFVLVLKGRAAGGDYANAASMDTPIDGLGINREDQGDTILYKLS
jgi:hypothetical protein